MQYENNIIDNPSILDNFFSRITDYYEKANISYQ